MLVIKLTLAGLLAMILISSHAAAETEYLEADFDDKTVDSPIGTGGPTLGEPVQLGINITATVRGAPMASPCLEIRDNDDFASGSVRFEFKSGVEITTGKVGISALLRFDSMDPGNDFHIFIREQGSSALSFANVNFISDGNVYSNNAFGPSSWIGNWEADRVYGFGIIFDMDTDTYDIWWDGQRALQDEPNTVLGVRGIGAVLFGCMNDVDTESHFFVDDILVADYLPISESEAASWGQVKALYR